MIVGRGTLRVRHTFLFSLEHLRLIERQLRQFRQLRRLKHLRQFRQLRSIERFRTLKAKCRKDGLDWLSYTAVTPRASLQSDANNNLVWPLYIQMLSTMNVSC